MCFLMGMVWQPSQHFAPGLARAILAQLRQVDLAEVEEVSVYAGSLKPHALAAPLAAAPNAAYIAVTTGTPFVFDDCNDMRHGHAGH